MVATIGLNTKDKHQDVKEEKSAKSIGQNVTDKTCTQEVRSKLGDILLKLADELKTAKNENQKKDLIRKFANNVVVLTSKQEKKLVENGKPLEQQSKLEEQIIQATHDTLTKSEMAYKAFEAALWTLEEDEEAIRQYIYIKQQAVAAEQNFEKLINSLI